MFSGLGQKQTVDFVLRVAESKQVVEVTGLSRSSILKTPTTPPVWTRRRLENLPNPGGDLTYPLQFAAGALINTAGSGNDFVGSTNGYGNVEFNGLPALANGYIVDGLETNDPLTNLNSGLSTNLVLGMNSISEVTVNTLSYSVDQGRYGASQVNYVTKSGTNQFHGNLYELWNGSMLNAADYFTNATPGNHKPRSTVNHFGGSIGGPIRAQQAIFLLRQRMGADCAAHRHRDHRAHAGLPELRFAAVAARRHRLHHRLASTRPRRSSVPFYRKMFSLYGNTGGTPLAVLGCPFNARRQRGPGNPPTATAAPTARASPTPATITSRCRPPASITTSTRTTPPGSAFRPTPDCRPLTPIPINPAVRRHLAAAALFLRRGIHARLFPESGELFQSGVFVV